MHVAQAHAANGNTDKSEITNDNSITDNKTGIQHVTLNPPDPEVNKLGNDPKDKKDDKEIFECGECGATFTTRRKFCHECGAEFE